MTFKEKLLEEDINEMETKIQTLLFLSENIDTLNEIDIHKHLKKVGLKLHKGDGIIDYVKQFATGAGKCILAAIKGDKEKVAEIAKSLDKAKVIDFLLKLDMATLHLVTGPIHFIDAVTGWDLMANLKAHAKKAESMVDIFKSAITKVKTAVTDMFDGKRQKTMLSNVTRLEKAVV